MSTKRKTKRYHKPGWAQFLEHMVTVEGECMEESYGAGRALNDADEEINAKTRKDFAELRAMMPVLLAAPELLAALQDWVDLYDAGQLVIEGEADEGDDPIVGAAKAAIAKATGKESE